MASYEQLLAAFRGMAPPEVMAQEGTPAFGDIFNQWASAVEREFGVQGWEAIPADQLGTLEFDPAWTSGPTSTTGPVDPTVFNQIAPGLATQILGDVPRQAEVGALTAQTGAAFGTLANTLGQAVATFDGAAYLRNNPDVAAAFAQSTDGLTVDQYAQRHYDQFGRAEGRAPTYSSQASLAAGGAANTAAAAQTTAASTAAAAQLAALHQSITAAGANLQGALGQQAAALAAQVAALGQGINTLNAAQVQALATQIAAQQANLEQSIAAQRVALEQQVRELQGNATAAAQARRVALEQQIAELTAAQAPVAEARLRGAEALTTAVNIGLESTTDQLRADAAREGFVGGSTMQDAALARAVVGARQDASQAGANARFQNAADTREIARLGAGGRFSIADVLAGQTQSAADLGATGGAALSGALATGTQAIGDFGATGNNAIANQTAANQAGLTAYGANTGYSNATAGIGAGLGIQQSGVQGQYDIAAELARQQQQTAAELARQQAGIQGQVFPNSLSAAQALTGLPAAQAAAQASLIPYGNAGTANALGIIRQFEPPNATPPVPTAVTTTPSTVGNAWGNIGSSLLGSAFQIGNWGRPASTTTPAATTTNATVDASRSGRTGLQWNPWNARSPAY